VSSTSPAPETSAMSETPLARTWARVYAECAAILDEDHLVPGAAAMFDQGLTNGLLAIVAQEWPGHQGRSGDRLKSAGELIGVVENMGVRAGEGSYEFVTKGRAAVVIHTTILTEAIAQTQRVRHGRAGGAILTEAQVAALVALDHHPALGVLVDRYADRSWRRAQVRDLDIRAHAEQYLEVIGEVEAERRAARIGEYLPLDPNERDATPEPQECPICARSSLICDGLDDFGMGIAAGICIVCSYERTSEVANSLATDLVWERHWRDA